MRIDLHAHSHHSDGVLAPDALFSAAARSGLTHLAVTDHDTLAGLPACAAAGRAHGVELVPGIEITAELHGREVHLLGHFLPAVAPPLEELLERAREIRRGRLQRMVEALNAHGIPVRWADVLEEVAGDATTIGRPHLARALVRRGFAEGMDDAFARFLVEGRPGFVPRARPAAPDAIARVRAAGGTATLAHPGLNKISRAELERLADAGLDGVEAFHHGHPPSQQEAFVRWSAPLGLVPTGGSDFHAPAADGSVSLGAFLTPAESFAALAERSIGRVIAAARAEENRSGAAGAETGASAGNATGR